MAINPQTSLQPGLRWAFDREIRFLSEEQSIDRKESVTTVINVQEVRRDGYLLHVVRLSNKQREGIERKLDFGRNGQPLKVSEDPTDLVGARVDRMMWTAIESRKGLSWSRVWPSVEPLPSGKVTVRPIADGRMAVSYDEGTKLHAEGFAVRDKALPTLAELSVTIDRLELADVSKPVKVSIRQTPKAAPEPTPPSR